MKARAVLVATLGVVATLLLPVRPSAADAPQPGTPGTFVTVTPSTNLPSPATVSVSGTGFRNNWTGYVLQCGVQPEQNLMDCVDRGTVTTNGQGAFGPVNFTVTVTFQPLGAPAIDCRTTTCNVFVTTEEKYAFHTIGFSGGTAPRHDVPADFDGDGDTDVSIYRPSTGQWFINGVTPGLVTWGASGDIPVPADYTGDNRTNPAVYRPSTGQWFINGGSPGLVTWGASGDIPVPADYTGDNRANVAVYRPSTGQWFINGGSPGLVTWGTTGDIPVPADYTGDGRADVAVYRPSTGQWFINGGSPGLVTWGSSGDIPVPGDYNNDGRWDAAVYRPSTGQWFVHNVGAVTWGTSGDIPLPLPHAIYRTLV